jgi:hypothetical protein
MIEFDTDNLKTDEYFEGESRLHHPEITIEHCRIVLSKYVTVRVQSDKKFQVWGQAMVLNELRWVKVIVYEDRRTLHNAYPDRHFKPPT